MDDATRHARVLEHPFYRAWAAGELTLDDLGFYSQQYWRQVESFPGYLKAIASRLDSGSARDTIVENLRDEIEGDHLGLWLEFASGVGAARDVVMATAPTTETSTCVTAFKEATRERSLPFALGMLYAYESQTPEVAATKIQGLRELYGINGRSLEYFELHGELDIEHSNDLAEAIAAIAPDEASAREAEEGAKAGAEAIWTLLDGISRERGIALTCN